MKSLQTFINEASDKDIFVVYFGDGTMQNFYYTDKEAQEEVDSLNKEMPSNKAYFKKEKLSAIEK